MKKQFVGSTIALAALVGMAGCASPQETAAPKVTASAAVTPPVREQSYTPGEAAGEKITIVATVVAIDLATRHVTLRWPEGGTDTIVVGEEVRNLPQVRVGDRVVIEYYQGLALALAPSASGIRKRTDMVTGERAAPGQKPAGVVTRTVEVDATVQAVDRQARTVTLRGPKRTVILKVAADVDLNKVKVGDGVHAIYQEALAVSVVPAAGR